MIAHKYLKLCANCIIISPSLMGMLDGSNLCFSDQSASSEVGGKYMASALNPSCLIPTCIWRQNVLK